MEKYMVGENGINYTLARDGLYYPDLELLEETCYKIGWYGRRRCEFLKEHHRTRYLKLLLSGKLNEYLHELEVECYEMEKMLIEQMKKVKEVIEQLKAETQMVWVGRMNNIRSSAGEVVLQKLIYS